MSLTVDGFILGDGDMIPRTLHNAPAVFRNFTADVSLTVFIGGKTSAIAGTTPEFYRFINAGDATAKPKVTITLSTGYQLLNVNTGLMVSSFEVAHGEEWLLIQERDYATPSIVVNVTAVTSAAEPTPDPLNVNTLNVAGATTLTGALVAQGAVTADSTLTVTGKVTASGELAVTGPLTASGGVTVTGDISSTATINATGDLKAGASLTSQSVFTKLMSLMNLNQVADSNVLVQIGQFPAPAAPGATANSAPTFASPTCQYLGLGGAEYGPNSVRGLGFGYANNLQNWYPAMVAYQETTSTQNTSGDLLFMTRALQTNTPPIERIRISADGATKITGNTTICWSAASAFTSLSSRYLSVGSAEKGLNTGRTIGFGYAPTAADWSPATIGFLESNTTGNTSGSLVFSVRAGTNNAIPDQRLSITSDGHILTFPAYVPTVPTSLTNKAYVDSKIPPLGVVAQLSATPGETYNPSHGDTISAIAATDAMQLPLLTGGATPDGFEFSIACSNVSGSLAISVPTNSDGDGFIKLTDPTATAAVTTINLVTGLICHFKVSGNKYVYYKLTMVD